MKHTRSILVCALVLMLSAFAFSPASAGDNILKRMSELDRAYVPTLALSSSSEDFTQARKALEIFAQRWQAFATSFIDHRIDEPDWKERFSMISSAVEQARMDLDNADIASAHAALEGVRQQMLGIRETLGAISIMDEMTRFHGTMEQIHRLGADGTVSDDERRQMTVLLSKALAQWEAVKSAKFSDDDFAFDKQKKERIREYFALEDRALKDVSEALQGTDEKALAQAAMSLKKNYARTFKLFGDFAAVQR